MFKLLLLLLISVAFVDAQEIKFTKKEKEWLSKNPTITYVYEPDWAPFEWKNDIDKHTGIISDIIQLIAKKTDIYFLPINTKTWAQSVQLAKQNKVDMYSGVIQTIKREEYMNFSFKDIYSYKSVFITNQNYKDIDLTLKNLQVAIVKENALGVYLKKKYPNITFINVNSTTDGLEALRSKKIDIFALNQVSAKYFIHKKGYTTLKIAKTLDYRFHLKIALSKEMPKVALTIIDKALSTISEEELNNIFNKWTEVHKKQPLNWKLYGQITFGIFGVLIFLLWHNRKLHTLVKEKTFQLNQTLEGLEYQVMARTNELSQSKQNLESTTNAITDSIYYKDLNFTYTWVNDAFCKYMHLPREEILGQNDFDLFEEDISIKSNFQDSKIVQDGKSIYFEDKVHSPVGKTIYISSHKHALKDKNNNIFAIVGTIADITVQKETEIEIRRQKDFIQTLIDSQEQLIITTDGTKLISANETFLDFFAVYSIDNFKEEYSYDCVCEAFNRDAPKEYLQIMMENEKWVDYLVSRSYNNQTHRVMISRGDSDFIFSVSATKLPTKEGIKSVIFTDITELEDAKESAIKAELIAQNANASKSEFLANMSHEIRTPMNAIIGFSELLHEQITDKHLKQFTKTIQSAGHTLLELINDILDISKIEAGKMSITLSPTNPYHLLKDTADIFTLKLQEKGLDLIVDIDSSIPQTIIIDEVRVRQIVLNLIGNAVKFTSSGYIKLCAKPIKVDDEASTVDLQISIEDSGIGIKENQIEKIFGSFEQHDGQDTKKYGGTGLGLSISTKLANMMDGELSVTSKYGEGTTFYLTLHNISISSIIIQREEDKESKKYKFLPATILLVDDIKNNRELVEQNFKDSDIKIITAHNGKVATEIAKTEDIDLVLMDIRMPIMDGYEAAQIIKEFKPVLPVIALTASVMEDEFERVKSGNFNGYLRKPILRKNLFEELAKYLKYVEEKKEQIQTQQEIFLGEKAEANLTLIKESLDGEISVLYEKVKKSNNMNDSKHFATKLLELSSDHEIEHLKDYSEALIVCVEIFDIMGMKKLLEEYKSNISIFN